MGDRQPGYIDSSCIHEGDIMFILAPVNAHIDTQGFLLDLMTGYTDPAQAAVHLLDHSQCGSLLTA